ncbi:MAG: response regulator [Pseudomonadota bacterium]
MNKDVIPAAQAGQHQTTKQRCRIVQFGLDTRETLVIESLFRMNAELASHFEFGEPGGSEPPDVVFVNGDDPVALSRWDALCRRFPGAVPIIATAGSGDFGGARVIRKPLSIRNFEEILAAITATAEVPAEEEAGDGTSLRVLVVDDSFPARQFMKLKLEELAGAQMHVHVDFADSGEKALRCVAGQHYDLVFLDVVMPGMDGYEACALIKSVQPVRVAMLTSRSAPVDFTRGRGAGCDHYLPKPPNDIDLRSVLRLTSLKKMTSTH